MKMESLQQRREELERKEYQLKESLLKFDKFLKVIKIYLLSYVEIDLYGILLNYDWSLVQENDSKRARALKKASEEREMKRGKDREINR